MLSGQKWGWRRKEGMSWPWEASMAGKGWGNAWRTLGFKGTLSAWLRDFPVAQMVKNLPAMQETWVRSLGQEVPWIRKWQPTPVFSPGEFHKEFSPTEGLVGYRPWGCEESEMTKQLTQGETDSSSSTEDSSEGLCQGFSGRPFQKEIAGPGWEQW